MDYVRHGVELSRLSEAGMMARFNSELGRAVRHETKRGEAAQRLIAMHRRHGEGVVFVLERVIQEQANKLARERINESSLLALFLDKKHLEMQRQEAQAKTWQGEQSGAVKELDEMKTDIQIVKEQLSSVLAKFGGETRVRRPKKRRLLKREAVIFAAILLRLKGKTYCSFLQEHGIIPKWSDAGHESYPKNYLAGDPWRKKVQDEKTRAKSRMNRSTDAELADAFSAHLSDFIDQLRRLIPTRAMSSARSE